MIIPLTPESEWRRELNNLPEWTPPRLRTVVISPHPDDETLGVGGLIDSLTRLGVEVIVVAVTDGENAYPCETGLGVIRETEQTAALADLGVPSANILRLRLTDSGLRENESALEATLRTAISANTHVIAPWTGDFHPDHEVCGRAARAVAHAAGATLTYYFFWTWHRGAPRTLLGLPLVRFPLTDATVQRKRLALSRHRSQLHHPTGKPILPENLLAPVQRPYEVYLPV